MEAIKCVKCTKCGNAITNNDSNCTHCGDTNTKEINISKLEAEIKELVRSGQKLQAIQYYRQQTGRGLADAKNYIDSLVPDMKIEPSTSSPKNRSGCTGVIALAIICSGLFYYLV